MTLEQLLSPAVLEWNNNHKHLPEEQLLNEFNKWIVDNEEQINESVKINFDEINEYNLAHDLSREINDKTVKIKSIALSLTD